MAEKLNPLHRLLKITSVYKLVQRLLPRSDAVTILYRDIVGPRPGERILDCGCGPASFRGLLGDVEYTGVDFNPQHIEVARKANPADRFICSDIVDFLAHDANKYDRILLIGLLHHLNDGQAEDVLKLTALRLAPEGTVIAFDTSFDKRQNPIAWLMAKLDQGDRVRYPQAYRDLANPAFESVYSEIRRDLLRLPFTHHVMRCRDPKVSG